MTCSMWWQSMAGGYRPGRVDQANQLRDNPKSRQVIKRSRWLLLRNPKTCPKGHEVKLTELLEANQPLNVVWLMKTALNCGTPRVNKRRRDAG